MISISILIPTCSRIELLERTLKSLNDCVRPKDRSIKVYIIENGSKKGVEKSINNLLHSFEWEYLYCSKSNKSAALNLAIQSIDNSFLIFFDDDVRLDPNILLYYDEILKTELHDFFCGGGLYVDYELEPESWLKKYLPLSAVGWHPKEFSMKGKLYFFGANWGAFSKDILRAGLFEEHIGPSDKLSGTGQEERMQLKLIDLRLKPVYVYNAVVWHYVSKERCTEKWALHRTFKNGITIGYCSSAENEGYSIYGVPFWMYKNLFIKYFMYLTSFFKSKQEAFDSKYHFYRYCGIVYGNFIFFKSKC